MADQSPPTPRRSIEPLSSENAGIWRVGRVALGVVLIVVGVVGCVLPIIPGIPFLLGGVALIGTEHPLIRPFAERVHRWREKWRRS